LLIIKAQAFSNDGQIALRMTFFWPLPKSTPLSSYVYIILNIKCSHKAKFAG
jgi:hypothetical protein